MRKVAKTEENLTRFAEFNPGHTVKALLTPLGAWLISGTKRGGLARAGGGLNREGGLLEPEGGLIEREASFKSHVFNEILNQTVHPFYYTSN